MRTTMTMAIELAIKQVARGRMAEEEYKAFQTNIRKSKLIRVGSDHKTVYDVIVDYATDIADFATKGEYSEVSDEVERKKQAAISNIKRALGWH